MNNLTTARVTVFGRVQGVFYRQTTKDKAQSLGLVGWVRNQDDGSVALEVSGPKEQVIKLIEWCHTGPRSARVDEVLVEWQETHAEYMTFEIQY